MRWSTLFPKPFTLNDGRVIKTLAEAGRLVLGLPELHRLNPHWISAAERIKFAAENPSPEAIEAASRQFSIALRAEGLLPFRSRR